MNITKDQWQKILSILLSAAIAIAAVLGWQIGVQPLLFPNEPVGYGARAVRERIGLDTPVDTWFYNGADVTLYSDNHSTQKIKLDGGTGAITAASLTTTGGTANGPLSVTGGITATGHVTAAAAIVNGALTVGGAATVGSVSTAGDVSARAITATGQITSGAATHAGALNMMNNVINNVGNAGTDFTAAGGLTLADDVSARAITATGQITGNSMYIGANAFTGPVRMISATVGNDTYVAHGFSGVQPKVVCSPFAGGLFTYTVFISATNAVSFSVGLADQIGNVPGVGSWVVNCIAQP